MQEKSISINNVKGFQSYRFGYNNNKVCYTKRISKSTQMISGEFLRCRDFLASNLDTFWTLT